MIDYGRYEEVLGRWRGARAGYCRPIGNVGDRLIDAGMGQLARWYGIAMVPVDRADVVFWAGGGNMGTLYPEAVKRRRVASEKARVRGVPFVILPQSWNARDETRFDQAFVRERLSQVFCPEAVLAPDIGLAYRPEFEIPAATEAEGWFFREDLERKREDCGGTPQARPAAGRSSHGEEGEEKTGEEETGEEKTATGDRSHDGEKTATSDRSYGGDPVRGVGSVREYVLRAARYGKIHTDRAHFAVAGLIAGREVVLYANSYHKNEGLAGEWGREFAGFQFSVFREEGVDEAKRDG